MSVNRCKFVCQSVTKSQSWNKTPEHPYVFEAKFMAVSSGSPENLAFFAATPSGSLSVGTYKDDVFEVGKEYFIDISLPEQVS